MQWTFTDGPQELQRDVDTMVALGGDLYVYGGTKRMQKGQDRVLSDILVARAQHGIVNQPWKQLDVSERPPSRFPQAIKS